MVLLLLIMRRNAVWAIASFSDSIAHVDFSDQACTAPFPLSEPFPLPRDLSDAPDYAAAKDDLTIDAFRNGKLPRVESRTEICERDAERRYSFTHPPPPFYR